jgi:outer membrane protein OmpA-like peptidoglycan-associated protein
MRSAAITAVREGSALGLVDLDGRPHLIMAGAFSDPGANSIALQAAQQQYLGSLTSAVERTRATFPHADVLDALNVAGRAIRAACNHGGTIYLEDSALQDVGPVNFGQAGMLGAAPADVVSFLAREHELPHLKGMTVVLVGIGDTAPPQLPLSIGQQANLIAIWSAVATAGGASSVRVDPAPLSGAAPANVPMVLTVPVPAVQGWTPADPSFVFPDSGPVGFEPNTPVFRHPAAARAALTQIADYLAAHPSARIELTGTTARWGTLAWDLKLSGERAQAVKVALVQLGAASDQIVTRGLGWQFPGYVDDQGPDGALLPGPAEHNRSVIVSRL